MTNYLNTHEYDGKWFEPLKEVLNNYTQLPSSIPAANFTQEQQYYVNMILNDQSGNVDLVNNTDAKTLLFILFDCLEKIKLKSTPEEYTAIWNIAMEQITDIANGPCPQGRTTRIFQLIAALASP